MAKKNQIIIDPQTGQPIQTAPKKKGCGWIVIIPIVLIVIIVAVFGQKSEPETAPSSGDKAAQTQTAGKADAEPSAPDLSAVATEYTLTAGHYYAGIDIPCGKFDVTAESGSGNIITTNMYSGGVNGMFGGPDADRDLYKEGYNGIKLPQGESMQITNDLVVKVTYSRIDSDFSGRTEDTANKITLTPGNYDAGEDFPAGLYTIRATEGSGNVSGNVYGGGLNAIMGAPGTDQSILAYIPEFKNASFKAGDELKVSGLTVELIPMIPGLDG